MIAVPHANAHGVDFRQCGKHFVFIGVQTGNAVHGTFLLEAFLVDIAKSIQLHMGIALIRVNVCAGYAADADNGNFQFFHGSFPL